MESSLALEKMDIAQFLFNDNDLKGINNMYKTFRQLEMNSKVKGGYKQANFKQKNAEFRDFINRPLESPSPSEAADSVANLEISLR